MWRILEHINSQNLKFAMLMHEAQAIESYEGIRIAFSTDCREFQSLENLSL
jgi:hypothetical protein